MGTAPRLLPLLLLLSFLGGGCGGTGGQGARGSAGSGPSAAGAPVKTYHFYLTILTGAMIGRPGYPTYSPGNFTLPPNSDMKVTIYNLDRGTAPVAAAGAKVSGTKGGMVTVAGKSYAALDPKLVSHTFTVPAIHLNVPIPAAATATFRFRTPKAGRYTWLCTAPCGSGPSGMQGAMRTPGMMTGEMRVSPD